MRQRRSKNTKPIGAFASIESSRESVSFSPVLCSSKAATIRLNASIRSPNSLLVETGRGNFALPSGPSISARVPACSRLNGREMERDISSRRAAHPGFLQLLEGLASVYALVLSNIPYQENLVIHSDASQKVSHLLRGGQR